MSVPDVTLDLVGALALRAHSTYRHALLLREYDEAGVEVGSLPTRQYALTGGGEGLVLELRSSPAGALLATGAPSWRGTWATGTLTVTTAATAETVTIGTRTYTLRTALTVPAVADEVLLGATPAETVAHLASAINGDDPTGVLTPTVTARHAAVVAEAVGADLVLLAVETGIAGNAIVTADTLTAGSWTGSTLAGATGLPGVELYWSSAELTNADVGARDSRWCAWALLGIEGGGEATWLCGGRARLYATPAEAPSA
jgi:hypothetical protein